MPLFGRGRTVSVPEPKVTPPTQAVCTRRACPDQSVTDCCYTDRDDRSCSTSWCAEHLEWTAERPYCVRHARVIAALSRTLLAGHRPAVANRAPSLVQWVADALDDRMETLLEGLKESMDSSSHDGGPQLWSIRREPISYVYEPDGEVHRWQRLWALDGPTGEHVRLALEVDEAHDDTVVCRVGYHDVESLVPPWVTHHRNGVEVSPAEDLQLRQAFYGHVMNSFEKAL